MTVAAPLSPPGKRQSFFTPAMQEYCARVFAPEDGALAAITRDAAGAGFPAIAISALDGQVLRLLVALCGARRAVEIGTLGGYSAAWIARAMGPGARLDCFELEADRAAFAEAHARAAAPGVDVVVHAGPALPNLARVQVPVDFVFIDADKESYPAYLAWAAENVRPGGVVALDNAFAWGGLCDPAVLGDRAPQAEAMRAAVESLARDERWTGAIIPTNEGLAVGVRR